LITGCSIGARQTKHSERTIAAIGLAPIRIVAPIIFAGR
jgi:hypothetical protein